MDEPPVVVDFCHCPCHDEGSNLRCMVRCCCIHRCVNIEECPVCTPQEALY